MHAWLGRARSIAHNVEENRPAATSKYSTRKVPWKYGVSSILAPSQAAIYVLNLLAS